MLKEGCPAYFRAPPDNYRGESLNIASNAVSNCCDPYFLSDALMFLFQEPSSRPNELDSPKAAHRHNGASQTLVLCKKCPVISIEVFIARFGLRSSEHEGGRCLGRSRGFFASLQESLLFWSGHDLAFTVNKSLIPCEVITESINEVI